MLSTNLKVRSVILAFIVLLSGLIIFLDQRDIDSKNKVIRNDDVTMNSQSGYEHIRSNIQ